MDSNEKELTLTPIAGKSGKAFMGTYPDGGKVFVKMNTTPILAGLAKEQIAPQLLWSRRLPDGNVMSAQEWLNGEILTPNGMGKKQVVHILTRLHRSRPLMTQLRKLGYTAESPLDLLNSLSSQLPIALRQNNYLQSLEVQVMLDTLRVIHNPLQDFALVALMKSPMFNFDEDELARLALQSSEEKIQENFYEKLVNAQAQISIQKDLIKPEFHKKLNLFMETVNSWRLFSKTHSLYDLIWKIYSERFYYDYVGALPNGQARQANLYALALRADQFEKSNFKGLSSFITMIDQVLEAKHDLASVTVAPPKDAVELMSIHKSKGLEFPYVFILNIDQQFNKQDSMSEVILSRKNGLGLKYVARVATNAKEEYVLSTIKL